MRGRLTASRGKAGLLRGRAGDRQRRPADLPAGEFDRNRPRRASVDRGANWNGMAVKTGGWQGKRNMCIGRGAKATVRRRKN